MFKHLFLWLGNLLMISGGVGVAYLLFSRRDISLSGLYTFLGLVVMFAGILIRHGALMSAARKNKKKENRRSWFLNERDDE